MSHLVNCCGGQARPREKDDPAVIVITGRCPLCLDPAFLDTLPEDALPFVVVAHGLDAAEAALLDHCDVFHGPIVPGFNMTFEETNRPGKPLTRRIRQ